MKVMALSIMEVMEVMCIVADGKEVAFRHDRWTHDNPFDWGLSFQAGLEIGSCDDKCRLRCLFRQGI